MKSHSNPYVALLAVLLAFGAGYYVAEHRHPPTFEEQMQQVGDDVEDGLEEVGDSVEEALDQR